MENLWDYVKYTTTMDYYEILELGITESYLVNGNLKNIGTYVDGKATGEWKVYHDNNSIYQIKHWDNGKLLNIISCYDNEGNPLDKGSLINGNGTVNYYDESGHLTSTKTYIDGVIEKE